MKEEEEKGTEDRGEEVEEEESGRGELEEERERDDRRNGWEEEEETGTEDEGERVEKEGMDGSDGECRYTRSGESGLQLTR